MPLICPCCSTEMIVERQTDALVVHVCSACRHRCAVHKNAGEISADYHAQYDQGAFLRSLEKTRRRQANLIIDGLLALKIPVDQLIDFGAGRGWFLEEVKKRGGPSLAGADTSDISVRTLQALGVETSLINIQNNGFSLEARTLSFQPAILSLLDVIEHFPPASIENDFRKLLSELAKVRWVVIKVPISNGILFWLASLLSKLGWNKPYHQLFQVGTFPPHFNYFSKKSLDTFLLKINIHAKRAVDDPDIDDLLGRATGRSLGWISYLTTKIFCALAKLTSADARIIIGEVTR